jgi:hypothetical protein
LATAVYRPGSASSLAASAASSARRALSSTSACRRALRVGIITFSRVSDVQVGQVAGDPLIDPRGLLGNVPLAHNPLPLAAARNFEPSSATSRVANNPCSRQNNTNARGITVPATLLARADEVIE